MADPFDEMAAKTLRDFGVWPEDAPTLADKIAAALRTVAQETADKVREQCAEVAVSTAGPLVPHDSFKQGYREGCRECAAAIEALDLKEIG